MRWMSVMLTRDDIRAGKHTRLQNDFEKALLKTAAPKAAAMFVNDLSYYESGYYFSPGAVEIFAATLETFNARECGTPPRTGTSLLIGYSDAWDMLSTDAKSDGL